jgi:hypothetical protein
VTSAYACAIESTRTLVTEGRRLWRIKKVLMTIREVSYYKAFCMVKRSAEEPRLTRLTEIALELPEATRRVLGSHAQFLVRKKTFAYFLDNHHGDGIVAVTCKVLPGDNKAVAQAQRTNSIFPLTSHRRAGSPSGWTQAMSIRTK